MAKASYRSVAIYILERSVMCEERDEVKERYHREFDDVFVDDEYHERMRRWLDENGCRHRVIKPEVRRKVRRNKFSIRCAEKIERALLEKKYGRIFGQYIWMLREGWRVR